MKHGPSRPPFKLPRFIKCCAVLRSKEEHKQHELTRPHAEFHTHANVKVRCSCDAMVVYSEWDSHPCEKKSGTITCKLCTQKVPVGEWEEHKFGDRHQHKLRIMLRLFNLAKMSSDCGNAYFSLREWQGHLSSDEHKAFVKPKIEELKMKMSRAIGEPVIVDEEEKFREGDTEPREPVLWRGTLKLSTTKTADAEASLIPRDHHNSENIRSALTQLPKNLEMDELIDRNEESVRHFFEETFVWAVRWKKEEDDREMCPSRSVYMQLTLLTYENEEGEELSAILFPSTLQPFQKLIIPYPSRKEDALLMITGKNRDN